MDSHELLQIKHAKLRRFATYASIVVASILIGAKLLAYLTVDSMTLLSSLLDSTVDLLASLVTALGVASALRPPDHDHRFGHGKAEPLAALGQAAFIVGSSVLLTYEALDRIYHPQPISDETFGYIVMAISIVLTLLLLEFQRAVVKRTSSMAINADRLHYAGDVVINIAVMITLAIHHWLKLDWLDPLFAIGISSAMIYNACRIGYGALNVLMDKELPDEDHLKIKAIVEAHPEVTGLQRIRSRTDSDRVFMELHVEMDGGMALRDAHKVGDAIVSDITKAYPKADVLIHEDPTGLALSKIKN